jgi:hypothetical protein
MNREHLRAARPRKLMALLLAMILLAFTQLAGAPVGNADPPSAIDVGCQSQQAALDAVNADIATHNAKPHLFTLPQQQAAFDAYNAEKSQLDSRGAAAEQNLRSCRDAFNKASEGGPLVKPTQDWIDKLNDAKSKLPPGYEPPRTPPTNSSGSTLIDPPMKPVFTQMRANNLGDSTLKPPNKVGSVGDPDPARPGATIPGLKSDPSKPAVVPDHIVPLAQMMYMPGFLKLPAEQMYMVANSPLNLQWMSAAANAARSSGSAARVLNADPKWLEQQLALEESTRTKLQDVINQLLAAKPPG